MKHQGIFQLVTQLITDALRGHADAIPHLSLTQLQVLAEQLSLHTEVRITPEQLLTLNTPEHIRQYIAKALPDNNRVIAQIVPASPSQTALWLLDNSLPHPESYNVPVLVTIHQTLNSELLSQAAHALATQHEILRTCFALQHQHVVQRIQTESPIAIEHLTITEPQPPYKLIEQLASTPMSLANGPLVKLSIVTTDQSVTYLACCMHHIITDATSVRLFIFHLLQHYQALTSGQPLPDISISQYREFVAWQTDYLTESRTQSLLAYWRNRLDGPLPILDLPLDYPRSSAADAQGKMAFLALNQEESILIDRLARQSGMTRFMYCTMAYMVLLHNITRQADIIIGSPFSLRDQPQFEQMQGFLVNTVPLRTLFTPDLTVKMLIANIRDELLNAMTHKHLPFVDMVTQLKLKGEKGVSPVFQTMFVMPNSTTTLFDVLPFKLEIEEYLSQVAKYDLMLFVETTASGLLAAIEYKPQLFAQQSIECFLAIYKNLLLTLGSSQEQTVASLTILNPQQQQTIVTRSSSQIPAPAYHCVIQEFEQIVSCYPHQIALSDTQTSWTYQELNRQANQVATALNQYSIQPGQRVALFIHRSNQMIAALIGLLKTGATYVPIDPEYPAERIDYMLQDASVNLTLTTTDLATQLPEHTPYLCLDCLSMMKQPKIVSQPRQPEGELYVIYTSGSTGHPKGVILANKTLTNLIEYQKSISCAKLGSKTLQYMSLSFDVSIQEIFGTLCTGGTLFVTDETTRKDLHYLQELITTQRINRLYFPYVALQQFVHLALLSAATFPELEEVYSTGEQLVLTADIKTFFRQHSHTRLFNLYGPSESHVCSCACLPVDIARWGDSGSIGFPLPGFTLLVLNEQQQLVPSGITGELYIASNYLSPGYNKLASETAKRFLPSPITPLSSNMYKTGDLVKLELDNSFTYLGRMDNQLKIRGFRIEPAEVEAAINQIPQVRVSAVIGHTAPQGGKKLVAYVAAPESLPAETIRQQLAKQLPNYMIPTDIIIIDHLPTTPSGKIDRKTLASYTIKPQMPIKEEHLTPTEQTLKNVWTHVLHADHISKEDDFFHIGGHSILATELVYRLRQQFAVDLPLKLLFEHPTLTAMASCIDKLQHAPLITDEHEQSDFILDAQHPLDLPSLHQLPLAPIDGSVLLTGATGFLGIYLLRELLTVQSKKVICLVRATDAKTAQQRLQDNARFYQLEHEIDFSRVIVHTADISQPLFGLTVEEYNQLTATVISVYHAAAHINFVMSYASVKPTNVEGVRHLLTFCATTQHKPFHHLSTIAVFSPEQHLQPIDELTPTDQEQGLRIGYTQSKWVAEQLVEKARQQGLQANIYRIGRISGDRRNGACQANDFLWRQIHSFIQLAAAPYAETLYTELLPVDFVSQAVVALARGNHHSQHVFHLFHPDGCDFTPVYQAIRDNGYPLRLITLQEWIEQLEQAVLAGQQIALGAAVHLFKEGSLEVGTNRYLNQLTQHCLQQHDLTIPPITVDSFNALINFFIRKGEILSLLTNGDNTL